MTTELFPSSDLFPSDDLFPGEGPEGEETPMARTEIPVADITLAGTSQSVNAVVAGAAEMEFSNEGLVFLEVKNASTSTAQKFTLVIPGFVGGFPIADVEISVAKEVTELFGPFAPEDFNAKGSLVLINAANAELKFRAFRL